MIKFLLCFLLLWIGSYDSVSLSPASDFRPLLSHLEQSQQDDLFKLKEKFNNKTIEC